MSETQIPPQQDSLSRVDHIVAVVSAKGGVGKSTTCVNLALSLAASGCRVGVLDTDIYGPSIPLMLGVCQTPDLTPSRKIIPVMKHGISLISVGLMAGSDAPVVWRGPLLGQAVQQFLQQVEWGELQYLLVDLPPGTGDVPLTLSQTVELTGAVVVTTPQRVSIEDVVRGVAMFERVEVDIIGLVQNMSYFVCPHCDKRHHLFGEDGGVQLARRLSIPLLGEIPLDPDLCAGCDVGLPPAIAEPEGAIAVAYADLATALIEQICKLD